MLMGQLLFQITVALFAVLGFLCAIWMMGGLAYRRSVCAAICIRDAVDRESLDLLLSEARVAHRAIVVLFFGAKAECCLSPQEQTLLTRYGAQWYFVTEDPSKGMNEKVR